MESVRVTCSGFAKAVPSSAVCCAGEALNTDGGAFRLESENAAETPMAVAVTV